ncbi:MAG: YCF48-related protein [bacterium]
MKTIRLSVALLPALWVCAPLEIGFSEGRGGVGGDNIFSSFFLDEKQGWVCGDRGAVYHTSDGGLTWEKQTLDTNDPLAGISFCNTDVGWVVGKKGIVFHTVDGGKTWNPESTPKDKYLLTVEAVSPEKCWAAGDWGTILYTEDGGRTWTDKSYAKDMVIYSIEFKGESEGWMACEFGTVLHTRNGGKSWTEQNTGSKATLFGVSFSSDKEGVAVGLGGVIVRTEDGGETWQEILGVKEERIPSGAPERSGGGEELRSLYDVKLGVADFGIAVGDSGRIVITEDGGESWGNIELPLDMRLFWLRAVSLAGRRGVIVGARSIVVLTEGDSVKASSFLTQH